MSQPLWKDILSYVVPLLAVVLSYLCGCFQNRKSTKRQTKEMRYKLLYSVFIRKIYIAKPWEIPFSSLSTEARSATMDIISDNLQYAGKDAMPLFVSFYTAYLKMLTYENNPYTNQSAPLQLDQSFNALARCLLLQASALSKDLFLPDTAAFALAMFAQSDHKQK